MQEQPADRGVELVRVGPGTEVADADVAAVRDAVPVRADGELRPDLCVIGAGSGGLTVAAGAAQLGVSVVLVEKHKMGGDCQNYGCVPSKALIASARRAHVMRTCAPFGIVPTNPTVS
jgi:heterodisulfide reductase subunit A-like polyferredoxin